MVKKFKGITVAQSNEIGASNPSNPLSFRDLVILAQENRFPAWNSLQNNDSEKIRKSD